jgi:ATP-dependent protease HslVU (ClpYQ) peptidase subunit
MAYCTHRDLKDIYPAIDEYDSKTPLYGWVELFSHAGFKLFEAFNTGLVTILYQNGEDLTPYNKVENYSDSSANTNEAVDNIETAINVTDGSVFGYGDIIKIDDEKMLVINIGSNTLTVKRGFLGTTTATHNTATDVYIGVEWSEAKQWLYSDGNDSVLLYEDNVVNPNDYLLESGDDWSSLVTRYISNAEKYLDSRLDGRLPRKQFKDKDGNYDYILVRTTALIACSFLIRSHQPTSEIADALFEEAEKNILSLNEGTTKLSWQVSGDSSKGVIREVSVSGNIKLVDTRGHYYDIYDRIGVKITTGGALGTAVYSVWRKDADNLGAERMNNGESSDYSDVINGQYQPLSGDVYIRFAGDTADTATLNDKWELEFFGKNESVDDTGMPYSIRMSRR